MSSKTGKNKLTIFEQNKTENSAEIVGKGAVGTEGLESVFSLSGSLSGGYYNPHMGEAGRGIVCLGSDSCGPGAAGPKGAH
jgi:hypothetical protein